MSIDIHEAKLRTQMQYLTNASSMSSTPPPHRKTPSEILQEVSLHALPSSGKNFAIPAVSATQIECYTLQARLEDAKEAATIAATAAEMESRNMFDQLKAAKAAAATAVTELEAEHTTRLGLQNSAYTAVMTLEGKCSSLLSQLQSAKADAAAAALESENSREMAIQAAHKEFTALYLQLKSAPAAVPVAVPRYTQEDRIPQSHQTAADLASAVARDSTMRSQIFGLQAAAEAAAAAFETEHALRLNQLEDAHVAADSSKVELASLAGLLKTAKAASLTAAADHELRLVKLQQIHREDFVAAETAACAERTATQVQIRMAHEEATTIAAQLTEEHNKRMADQRDAVAYATAGKIDRLNLQDEVGALQALLAAQSRAQSEVAFGSSTTRHKSSISSSSFDMGDAGLVAQLAAAEAAAVAAADAAAAHFNLEHTKRLNQQDASYKTVIVLEQSCAALQRQLDAALAATLEKNVDARLIGDMPVRQRADAFGAVAAAERECASLREQLASAHLESKIQIIALKNQLSAATTAASAASAYHTAAPHISLVGTDPRIVYELGPLPTAFEAQDDVSSLQRQLAAAILSDADGLLEIGKLRRQLKEVSAANADEQARSYALRSKLGVTEAAYINLHTEFKLVKQQLEDALVQAKNAHAGRAVMQGCLESMLAGDAAAGTRPASQDGRLYQVMTANPGGCSKTKLTHYKHRLERRSDVCQHNFVHTNTNDAR